MRRSGRVCFRPVPGFFPSHDFQSIEETRGVLKKYKEHYRTDNLKAYVSGNRKQRHYIVAVARELEMLPTTEGAADFKLDLTHAIDGFHGNEHNLPITPLYKDVIELYARSGIGYTPTLLVAYGGPGAESYFQINHEAHDDPKLRRFAPHQVLDRKFQRVQWYRDSEHVFSRLAADAAKIIRAGGRVGVGGHGQLQGLGYHWEMWALHSGGLEPMEILRAATLHGAEILGYAQDLGSLEPGKLADLVILDENPLEDIHHSLSIALVMKNGELFEAETLRQVWPVQKEPEELWWWSTDKDGG